MKKIILFLLTISLLLVLVLPVEAAVASVNGSIVPPPSPSNSSLTSSFSLMRSYADVTSLYINSTALVGSAEVNMEYVDYFPTLPYSTPNTWVAPSLDGFGDVSDYGTAVSYQNQFTLTSMGGGSGVYITSFGAGAVEDVWVLNENNAITYRHSLNFGSTNYAYQYGTITGEWIYGTSIENKVNGYAIYWSNTTSPYSLKVKGKLIYGSEGHVVDSVDIDRTYNLTGTFVFEPQTLLEYEDTINYDYYVFTGNWTVYCESVGHLVEYKAFDAINTERVNYVNGINEYEYQTYSVDLNPITRIISNLSTTVQTPTGTLRRTLTENGTFTYDVSQYAEVEINTDVPQEILQDVNAFNWLFGAVNGFLQMEILPGFSLGGIVLFIAGLALLIWILKIFLGG